MGKNENEKAVKVVAKCDVPFGKIDLNRIGRRVNLVELHVELREDRKGRPVLSVTCNVWNSKKTDCDMCGQCLDIVSPQVCDNRHLWVELRELWRRWHLNDSKAGTPYQYELLGERFKEQGGRAGLEEEIEYLKSVGHYEEQWNGETVRWGERYIYWEIPEKTLGRIREIIGEFN